MEQLFLFASINRHLTMRLRRFYFFFVIGKSHNGLTETLLPQTRVYTVVINVTNYKNKVPKKINFMQKTLNVKHLSIFEPDTM